MRILRAAAAWICLGLALVSPIARAQAPAADASSSAPPLLLRLFLIDGATLISYGEPARIGDRVVFSLPVSDSLDDPQLHLVDIPADRVDWHQTTRYAAAARAAAYVAAHGERQYALLTAGIGDALNEVALTSDPARRLAIVERARRTLAEWPATHYNYKAAEIQGMLTILDEAIADLRSIVGVARFDLSFVAPAAPVPAPVPLLPPPTPREAIEGVLAAARVTESPAERMSLMQVALSSIERHADRLPGDWRTYTRKAIETVVAAERRVDLQYLALTTRTVSRAEVYARAADVRGLERLLSEIHRQDQRLGAKRPDSIGGLVATIEDRLDAARRLSLSRERWALRMPELRKFEALLGGQADRLSLSKGTLEDIRMMMASPPAALASIERTATDVLEIIGPMSPPDELRASHSLLVSASQLAASAARIRREAAFSGDLSRAWDASSAAAGALMLTERALTEMAQALSHPQLQQ